MNDQIKTKIYHYLITIHLSKVLAFSYVRFKHINDNDV